jgi:oligoendopeptidase F
MFQQGTEFSKEFNARTSFMREALLNLPDDATAKYLADPVLSKYRDNIVELRRRKARVLNEDAERILGLAGDNLFAADWPTSDVELIFKAVQRDVKFPKIKDEDGKEVQLNLSNYSKYRSSKDRGVRKEAVTAFLGTLKQYQNIFSAALAGEFKRDIFFARARKYDRAVDAYLDIDNIDTKVMDNLISTIHANLKPLHRYVELRKKIFKLKDVHLYDLYPPLAAEVDADIPYGEGSKMVVEALEPLGKEYTDVVAKATGAGSGWIDVYPNKGKESGAFSTSAWGIHPFIKLNYQDRIDDVSTLAHELGHTVHSYLNNEAQPFNLSGYSTFTAEIASTLNERLLNDYLLKRYKDDKAMKLYILGELLENIRTTIYRQTLFAEFERKIHDAAEKGEPITAELLDKTYIDLIRQYYGPGFSIDKDDDIEWAFIPHFYYKYYVYAYATGLSSGLDLGGKILKEGAPARDRYLAMLKEPVTEPPLAILKKAGVDLTRPDAILAASKLMNDTITEIERLIK